MNTIAILFGYIMVIVFALYTFFCFTVLIGNNEERKNRIFGRQRLCIFLIMSIAHILLYIKTYDFTVIIMYVLQIALYFFVILIYQIFYKKLSKLVLNNMIMLLATGLFMLERINMEAAIKQLAIAAAGLVVCIFIPVIINKFKYFDRFGWIYGFVGLILIAVVYLFAEEIGGAKNWIVIKNVAFQPSEFVKILYVFFVAALMCRVTKFRHIIVVSALAAAHVLVLIIEKDLGGALIFFVTYLFVLVVATGNYLYLAAGLLSVGGAGYLAFQLFSHVRTRFMAWQDPWSIIDAGGYQVTQSLFAIATGGLFGLGFGNGKVNIIPVVESDFIFSAICEELGGVYGLFILLVYLSCFIMFVNISMKISNTFFKYTSLGLGVMFIFQVFLAVGGVIKFIPSTGVTLPLISYGGSSVLSVIIMFSIIQGMYVLNKSENEILDGEEDGEER
ncbi:MAG: FtsW/RodA/SpoVE family cell cycle protein [Lachnospiraceae bacterium]|nr:FtsW/RodA/SpoVE family cell cycle protein [Lachnospiraceae bacterium]